MDPFAQLKTSLSDRYELDRQIGAGGMATVYLARDVKHDRKVAVKLLSPELGAVLGVERFLSEIRVTANLQHPHLLPLFDSGESDGLLFYVMPYVDGETLRHRLEREKQLPIDEAVRIAVAVASALDYAHRHGVVHRDLKPENILLHEGQPLIADFGIALAISNAGGARVTQTGLSLGTPQYMSPEQATGDRAIDGRTDIYSLGAVLYEMLTGEPPHTGNTVQAVIAKVLTDKPRSVRLSRDTVPPHVEAALEHALAKLPADRWPTAAQFCDALQGGPTSFGGTSSHAQSEAPAALPASRRRARLALLALPWLLLLALVPYALTRTRGGTTARDRTVRFILAPAKNGEFTQSPGNTAAISNDGSRIMYVGSDRGASRLLYSRAIEDPEIRALPGTANAFAPFFSPDGKSVAFFTGGDLKLKRMPTDGGPPITVASVTQNPQGATWAAGDVIVIGSFGANNGGLVRVPAAGGEPRAFTSADTARGHTGHYFPVAIGDGRTIAFTIWTRGGPEQALLALTSLDDGKVYPLDIPGVKALGYFDGVLTYVRADGTAMAVPFDLKKRRVTGQAVTLFEGVNIGAIDPKIYANTGGDVIYDLGANATMPVLVNFDGGETKAFPIDARAYEFPRFSPDGKRLAFALAGAHVDVWVYELATNSLTRLTTEGTNDRPEWTPDSRRIVFRSTRSGKSALWWQPVDGSGPAEILTNARDGVYEGQVSPDGRTLVYRVDSPNSSRDIYTMSLEGERVVKPFSVSAFDELMPRFSPDGKWIVLVSNESGEREVYVRPFPGPGGRFAISSGGGSEPVWSRDGKKIFYRSPERMMAANLATAGGTISVTSREPLFATRYAGSAVHPAFDLAPDGRSLLMMRPTEDQAVANVVLNWAAEVKARLARSGAVK